MNNNAKTLFAMAAAALVILVGWMYLNAGAPSAPSSTTNTTLEATPPAPEPAPEAAPAPAPANPPTAPAQ